MKLGICTDISNAEKLAKLQDKKIFSEIELSCGYISALDCTQIEEIVNIKQATGIKTSVVNCLMAGTKVTLFNDENFEESKKYLEELAKKLDILEVHTVVFGSGGYRKIPDGVTNEDAFEKICQFIVVLCEVMQRYNIMVVIEPLNLRECNVINTTTEAVRYIKTLNISNLFLLLDLYHFDLENEPVNNIYLYKPYIKHIHIAALKTRKYMTAQDKDSFDEYINAIKDIDSILSLEGQCNNEEFDIEIEQVIEFYNSVSI